MNPTAPGLRLHVGLSGHGKTHLLRHEVFAAARAVPVMVLDPTMDEWTRPPGNRIPRELAPDFAFASSVAEAAALLERGKRCVVVMSDADLAAQADAACRWARGRRGAGIALPEAHEAMPLHGAIGDHVRKVLTTWRHTETSLWADTQEFAQITRRLDKAQVIRVFSATHSDDARLRERGGPMLVGAVHECARRNTREEHGGLGQPGWHVALYEGVRLPRYRLERHGSTPEWWG